MRAHARLWLETTAGGAAAKQGKERSQQLQHLLANVPVSEKELTAQVTLLDHVIICHNDLQQAGRQVVEVSMQVP